MTATQAAGTAGAARSGAPLLEDLMPWSAAGLRTGRGWPMASDPGTLTARWERLIGSADHHERARLFRPSRLRTLHSAVGQLPGHRAATTPLAAERGGCPQPVPVLHGSFDRQWLIPDHRLLDTARPELWRVLDDRQIFLVARLRGPVLPGPAVVPSAILPDGWSPAGSPARIRPLFRRPGAVEPNLAPGLLDLLADILGCAVTAEDFACWTVATAFDTTEGCAVPLTSAPGLWQEGVALGRRALWLHTRGARGSGNAEDGTRPRMPGGRRPYVRAALPDDRMPGDPVYDPAEETLHLATGRIAPVAPAAWEASADGAAVLGSWCERRTRPREPGTLDALRPAGWPQQWTSDLLDLITVLSLLAELRPDRGRLAHRLTAAPGIDAADLHRAGVLPVPNDLRRPSSVLDHREEGPGGQFALL